MVSESTPAEVSSPGEGSLSAAAPPRPPTPPWPRSAAAAAALWLRERPPLLRPRPRRQPSPWPPPWLQGRGSGIHPLRTPLEVAPRCLLRVAAAPQCHPPIAMTDKTDGSSISHVKRVIEYQCEKVESEEYYALWNAWKLHKCSTIDAGASPAAAGRMGTSRPRRRRRGDLPTRGRRRRRRRREVRAPFLERLLLLPLLPSRPAGPGPAAADAARARRRSSPSG